MCFCNQNIRTPYCNSFKCQEEMRRLNTATHCVLSYQDKQQYLALKRNLEYAVDSLASYMEYHREKQQITCAEDCWCWDAEHIVNIFSDFYKKDVDS